MHKCKCTFFRSISITDLHQASAYFHRYRKKSLENTYGRVMLTALLTLMPTSYIYSLKEEIHNKYERVIMARFYL